MATRPLWMFGGQGAGAFLVMSPPRAGSSSANHADAGRISLCGEESCGHGSDHIREKDWPLGCAVLVQFLTVCAAVRWVS